MNDQTLPPGTQPIRLSDKYERDQGGSYLTGIRRWYPSTGSGSTGGRG